jgi:hypothetical protein
MSGTNGAKRLETSHLNSALLVTAVVLVVALAIAPFASGQSGSAGLGGLSIAAAICLATAWITELVAAAIGRHASPLAIMALGMMFRMMPPLALCVVLAARGVSGREHLAFIFYLLGFYLVTLAMETWTSVARVAAATEQTKSLQG